ncbi:hypothetical protein EYC84_003497 [Monilinia fructicola]|uniref:Uncharacterized protein n=1 Tax=Monilinia fructicola TaxID=38448 RepID=A0A5M9JWB3_MONFR|nr:hypothetical protein EYC84_003497 [Monilinia fructicola]
MMRFDYLAEDTVAFQGSFNITPSISLIIFPIAFFCIHHHHIQHQPSTLISQLSSLIPQHKVPLPLSTRVKKSLTLFYYSLSLLLLLYILFNSKSFVGFYLESILIAYLLQAYFIQIYSSSLYQPANLPTHPPLSLRVCACLIEYIHFNKDNSAFTALFIALPPNSI